MSLWLKRMCNNYSYNYILVFALLDLGHEIKQLIDYKIELQSGKRVYSDM